MKREIHIIFLLSIFLSISAFAGPVHNRIYTLIQPDGSSFQARFHGDEFMRIKTDLHGHAIMQDKDGWWCYASYQPDGRKQCSSYKVGSSAPYMVVSRSLDIPYARLSQSASARRTSYGRCSSNTLTSVFVGAITTIYSYFPSLHTEP